MFLELLGILWKSSSEQVPPAMPPNIGEDLRIVVQSKEFEEKLHAASPFLISSVLAWPTFWLYKGFSWPAKRGIESLQVYIRKTFYQAKLIQLFIIAAGLIVAISHDPQHTLLQDVQHKSVP